MDTTTHSVSKKYYSVQYIVFPATVHVHVISCYISEMNYVQYLLDSVPDMGMVAELRPSSLSAWQVKLAKYLWLMVSMERISLFSRPSNNSSSSVDRRRIGPWNQISWNKESLLIQNIVLDIKKQQTMPLKQIG